MPDGAALIRPTAMIRRPGTRRKRLMALRLSGPAVMIRRPGKAKPPPG
ncbi:hypothetical protein HMPREF3207_00939, partial [Citrobacter koseri]